MVRSALEGHDPDEDRRRVEGERPTAAEYYARYQEIWDRVRQTAESRELLTWPDFPIRYVPRPHWVRDAAPDLYFLYYRSPAAFGRPPVHARPHSTLFNEVVGDGVLEALGGELRVM